MIQGSKQCVDQCPEHMVKNGTLCVDNCQKSENSMRYFDFEELKCKMCKDTIEGCNKCTNEDTNNSPICIVCDAGLFPTFNHKKCTKCENLWDVYDPELDKCIPCSEYFPFCGRCEINDGEFVCHEC